MGEVAVTTWTSRCWRIHGPRKKQEALQTGVRGETYYWDLRRLGYIFIARNYMPWHAKGELDLIGFDADTLAVVEVRTRLARKDLPALPEMSITNEKHEVLVRTAHYLLRKRHIEKCPLRFDVVAIENTPGQPPCRAPAQSRSQSGRPSAIPIENSVKFRKSWKSCGPVVSGQALTLN
jgi:Holliday junction resolvase-like predicted endonuclease